jgi:leader peptidase (prepilin peptidase)/N-methyltransferase
MESFGSVAPFLLFVVGACLGSFANVIIYRLPQGISVVTPGSRCGTCGKPVRWYFNIPILSWFILRGRCAECGSRFSFRYSFVELLTASLFLAAWYVVGPSWFLFEVLIFLFSLVVVSFIDIDHFILPDIFTLSGIAIGLVGAALNPERSFVDALVGVCLGGGFLWAIAYFYFLVRKEEGMGGGDIKLLAWIGAVLGWKAIAFVIISSSVIGSIFGIWAAIRSKKGMKTIIPYGPYLALGSVLWIFGGESLGLWYLKLFLPFLENT